MGYEMRQDHDFIHSLIYICNMKIILAGEYNAYPFGYLIKTMHHHHTWFIATNIVQESV